MYVEIETYEVNFYFILFYYKQHTVFFIRRFDQF